MNQGCPGHTRSQGMPSPRVSCLSFQFLTPGAQPLGNRLIGCEFWAKKCWVFAACGALGWKRLDRGWARGTGAGNRHPGWGALSLLGEWLEVSTPSPSPPPRRKSHPLPEWEWGVSLRAGHAACVGHRLRKEGEGEFGEPRSWGFRSRGGAGPGIGQECFLAPEGKMGTGPGLEVRSVPKSTFDRPDQAAVTWAPAHGASRSYHGAPWWRPPDPVLQTRASFFSILPPMDGDLEKSSPGHARQLCVLRQSHMC